MLRGEREREREREREGEREREEEEEEEEEAQQNLHESRYQQMIPHLVVTNSISGLNKWRADYTMTDTFKYC
jgi:hypothetical protein